MKSKNKEEIMNFLLPYAEKCGVEIYDVEIKLSKNPSLTIVLDKEGGIDLDTCELFHNAILDPIDTLDPIDVAYTLNVSSPGLDRPLKTQKDFDRRIGKMCEVKLFAPYKGLKYFEAELKSFDGQNVELELNGEVVKFPLNKIAKINELITID